MGNSRKVRWAIALLVVGVGYDIVYFVRKRRPATSHGEPVHAAPSAARPQAAEGPEVDVALYASLLGAEAELHQTPTLITRAARNPFATVEEQQRGLRYDQILAARNLPDVAETKAEAPVAPKDPLAGFVLKAVLSRGNGSVALVNEMLLSCGDLLPDSEWRIESIEQSVIHLRNGTLVRDLRVP
ncbi:MAG: hypothetical protein U1E76_05615 [Planctomycetota bacterium]